MDLTVHRETYCRQVAHKLITFLHSKLYRPSGTQIHRQNLYAPRSKRRPGRHEAQSREPFTEVKKLSVVLYILIITLLASRREDRKLLDRMVASIT
jgi:hypothetical protein